MKVGIIGAGGIAKTMGKTLLGMEDAVGYAIASRDREKAQRFAEEFQMEKAYGSYEELVCDPEVELVYIATPHSHHYEHAKLCIEHGKPVLVEKPFTANAKQAKELLALAKEKHVFITEAIWTRYLPSRKQIDEVLASGEIGKVVSLTANLGYQIKEKERLWNPALAGGSLLDVGIYPLTFASMVLGNEIEEVVSTCTKTESGVDELNAVILKYKTGQIAVLHSGMLAATDQYGIVHGTKGFLVAKNINNVDKIEVYDTNRSLQRELDVPEQITGFEYEVRAAMRTIREGKLECAEIPHGEILFMMELMDSLRKEWGIRYPFE